MKNIEILSREIENTRKKQMEELELKFLKKWIEVAEERIGDLEDRAVAITWIQTEWQ